MESMLFEVVDPCHQVKAVLCYHDAGKVVHFCTQADAVYNKVTVSKVITAMDTTL
jgi:hypothetical protein